MSLHDGVSAALRLGIAAALFGVTASGCAPSLAHRGGPSLIGAPASGGAPATPSGEGHEDGFAAPAFAAHALGEARAHAEQSASEPYWPYRVAQLESAAGHVAEAERALRTALARDSSYAPALTQLSRLLYAQRRHDDALRLLAPVRERRVPLGASDRSALLAGLALHEAALGHNEEARAVLGMAASGDREDAAGVAAYLAVRGGTADSAARLTEDALRAAPESAANHNNRGIALLRSADPDAAAFEFERAIALDPALPGPWYNLAILERWYRLDPVAAAQRFQQYWTRSHADPDSLYAELGHGPSVPVAEEGHPR